MIDPTNTPLHVASVTLLVHDLDAMRAFYTDTLGLAEIAADADGARLGVGERVLLVLRRDAAARRRGPREAGLFHSAFLLPDRAALGNWLRHARRTRVVLQGAAQHGVSEALYLSDPEGNGIEIYADTASDTWHWRDGQVAMRTEPLDADGLMSASDASGWHGVPGGTILGHVHLQVGAIAPAERFVTERLGMPLTARYPGGSFFGSGGYHHHLAANVWNSRGAAPVAGPATGLWQVELAARDASVLEALRGRVRAGGVEHAGDGPGGRLLDPWNTAFEIALATSGRAASVAFPSEGSGSTGDGMLAESPASVMGIATTRFEKSGNGRGRRARA